MGAKVGNIHLDLVGDLIGAFWRSFQSLARETDCTAWIIRCVTLQNVLS